MNVFSAFVKQLFCIVSKVAHRFHGEKFSLRGFDNPQRAGQRLAAQKRLIICAFLWRRLYGRTGLGGWLGREPQSTPADATSIVFRVAVHAGEKSPIRDSGLRTNVFLCKTRGRFSRLGKNAQRDAFIKLEGETCPSQFPVV